MAWYEGQASNNCAGVIIRFFREFPGGPVVRTRCFHCHGPGSIPGWGTKILQATQPKKKERKEGREEGRRYGKTQMNFFSNPIRFFQSRKKLGTSLVAQSLRIRLPIQGTWVRALVREDPTCRRATKPVCHNY